MANPFQAIQDTPEVATAKLVINAAHDLYKQARQTYLVSYNRVWNNSQATPDAIVTAMGTGPGRVCRECRDSRRFSCQPTTAASGRPARKASFTTSTA